MAVDFDQVTTDLADTVTSGHKYCENFLRFVHPDDPACTEKTAYLQSVSAMFSVAAEALQRQNFDPKRLDPQAPTFFGRAPRVSDQAMHVTPKGP